MFQFMTSSQIIFGEGELEKSFSIFPQLGYSVLLVSGENHIRSLPVVTYLANQNMRYQHVAISGEPYIKAVEDIAHEARKFKPDFIIAMGGGSVIDTGKALAGMIVNNGSLYDYVEVVGRDVPLKTKPLPFVAIPTTASSGAEVTRKAVLRSAQDQIKVSLRHADLIPDVVIVDPELTYGTDLDTSARGAMDAFTHLMEAYVCNIANPFTDMMCEEGLKKLSRALLPACLEDDYQSRANLCFAALLAGMASNNANLGAAHGLASALGGKLDAPHSVITARLAPYVMRENLTLAQKLKRQDIVERYQIVSRILTGHEDSDAESGILWVESMLEILKVPPLSVFGVCDTSFVRVANDALKSNSIKGNPLPLTQQRLVYILNQVCPISEICHIERSTKCYNDIQYLTEVEFEKGKTIS